MSVDSFLPSNWPSEIAARLDRWRQGHLVPIVDVAWLGPSDEPGPDIGSRFPGTIGLTAWGAQFVEARYAAVTSQTCDIAAFGPGAKHPFVQISPVRDLGGFPDSDITSIRRGEHLNYAYLTNPPVKGAHWAVDLRISVPLSKSVLLVHEPVDGFAHPEDELAFAERVAQKYRRPALQDAVAEVVPRRLDGFVRAHRKSAVWCECIEQFRLRVTGSHLHPNNIRLFVITDRDFEMAERAPLKSEWTKIGAELSEHNIAVQAAPSFITPASMSALDYRESVPVRVPALGRRNFA